MSMGYIMVLYSYLGIQFKLSCLVPSIVQLSRKEKAAGVNPKLQASRNTVRTCEDCAIHNEDLSFIPSLLIKELPLSEKIHEAGGHSQKTFSCSPWV